ncbi:MAG: hypothetical protein IJ079_02425 [Lachnospiraceae bacterium]|nr:hypothetical protein [Lachnospiraceae bacterium]
MKLQLDSSEYQEQPSNEKTVYSPQANDDIPVNDFSDLEEPTFRTTSTYTTPTPVKKSALPGWIIPAIIVVIIAIAAGSILPKKFAKHEVSSLAKLPKESIEQALGITLTEDPDYIKTLGIPDGDTTGFTAYTTDGKDFASVYYNGQPYGISFTNNKYELYGIKIGDSESHLITSSMDTYVLGADSGIGYPYTQWLEFLRNESMQYSSEYFFYGSDGGILVLHSNNTSHRIVNIQYYPNRTRYIRGVETF